MQPLVSEDTTRRAKVGAYGEGQQRQLALHPLRAMRHSVFVSVVFTRCEGVGTCEEGQQRQQALHLL